jgi:cytochrome c
VRVPVAPKETEPLRDRGEELYARFQCAACHGETGGGDGPAGAVFQRRGHEARIRDFTHGRFIRGTEMEDIYLTLRVGIEGTPMGPYVAPTNDDLWALAAYVRLLVREHPIRLCHDRCATAKSVAVSACGACRGGESEICSPADFGASNFCARCCR